MRLCARLALALPAFVLGCVAPPPTTRYMAAYDRGARLERENHPDEAAAAFGDAARVAARQRFRVQALYRQARQTEVSGRRAEALRLYLEIAERYPQSEMAPRCLYYAGRMAFEDGDLETGIERMQGVVERYPDNGITPQAVRRVVQQLAARGLRDRAADFLAREEERMRGTDIGDNLLYHAALLADEEGRSGQALELLERLGSLYPYPHSTLFDDAMWHAGRIALAAGEPQRALADLQALVSRRENSSGTGSYYTEWTDDAQLMIGRIHLERLNDPEAAAREFERLSTFPDSILADDGLLWASRAYMQQGDRRRSCDALARMLVRFPYSDNARQARAALDQQGCRRGSGPPP